LESVKLNNLPMKNKKKRFVEILKALENQWDYDTSHVTKLEVVYGDYSIGPYNNNFLVESLISELCHLVGGDKKTANKEICWFMYDLKFGKVPGSGGWTAETLFDKLTAKRPDVTAKILKWPPKEIKPSLIIKDRYDVNVSEMAYTTPLFNKEGEWVMNMEITKEEDLPRNTMTSVVLLAIDWVKQWDLYVETKDTNPDVTFETMPEFITTMLKEFTVTKVEK